MTQEWISSTDAVVWAEQFVAHHKLNPGIASDEGTMIGWFANAMQAALDGERQRKAEAGA